MKNLNICLLIVGMSITVFCISRIDRNMEDINFNNPQLSSNVWGPTSEGVQISIQASKEIVQRGESVLLKLYLRNSSKNLITVAETSAESDYSFTVTDDKKKTVSLTAYGERMMKGDREHRRLLVKVKPGQVIEHTVRIDNLYDLANSSTFFVSAKRTVFQLSSKGVSQVTSNTIKLQVVD